MWPPARGQSGYFSPAPEYHGLVTDDDHPGTGTAETPSGGTGSERYAGADADVSSAAAAESDDRGIVTRLLDRVPEATVALGAGFLLASMLVTAAVTVFGLYNLVTGNYVGFGASAAQVVLLVVTFGFTTVFQALAVRWARRRIKWTWVMLACAMATVSVVASPMSLPAAALLFVGKRHFTVSTPFWVVSGDDTDAA